MSDDNKEIKPSPRWDTSIVRKEKDFLLTPAKAWENFDGVYGRQLEMIYGIKV